MMIYFQIGFVILLGVVINYGPDELTSSKRRKATYIICCLTVCWIMASLRSIDWAESLHLDAAGYAYRFHITNAMTWSDLFGDFANRYLFRASESDIGYDLLCKLVGLFTDDYNIFSLITNLIFFIPFGRLLYKYTTKVRQIIFAVVFYIALMQVYLISGARQMLALGFDIGAVLLMLDEKKVKAFILFALGLTFHFSSILILIPLLLISFGAKPETLKRLHILSFGAAILAFLFPNQIIAFMGNAIGLEKYAQYGAGVIQGGSNTFIVLIELVSAFCYFAFDLSYLKNHQSMNRLYSMLPLLSFFGPLIRSNGSMIRICLYFFVYLTILFPQGLDQLIPKRRQSLVYVVAIGMLVFLVVRGGAMDYHFMWDTFY